MYQPFGDVMPPCTHNGTTTTTDKVVLDFDRLLAFHKAHFGDARMEVEPPPELPNEGGAPPEGQQQPPEDKGFPPNTPLSDMNVEQREAYWKFQAKKHEDRREAFKGLTPEDLAQLREKAEAHDALERELMSDRDKAVLDATEAAKKEAQSQLIPRLVKAEFKAAAAGKIEAEKLAKILEPLDLSRFLTDKGEVDEAKVAAYVDDVAPSALTPPRGPSATGLGRQTPTPREPGAQGKAMAEKRFGKSAVTS